MLIENLVIQMIGYVSTSKNGNAIPDEAKDCPWLLWPRFADRCAAGGWLGVVRCWEYTLESSRPLFLDTTPRATTCEELYKIATPERFATYKDGSVSMIDHYYDKLLHIHGQESGSEYLDEVARSCKEPLESICLLFGNGNLCEDTLHLARKLAGREAEVK